jgi:hypothetical protein
VAAVVVGAIVLIKVPTQNHPVLLRIQSTFEGSKEPSLTARDIKPLRFSPIFILIPIGGG